MSDLPADEQTWPTHCPTCGTELAHGVVDLDKSNEDRAEFNPGEMVAVDYCPNADCPTNREPGPDAAAGEDLPAELT